MDAYLAARKSDRDNSQLVRLGEELWLYHRCSSHGVLVRKDSIPVPLREDGYIGIMVGYKSSGVGVDDK